MEKEFKCLRKIVIDLSEGSFEAVQEIKSLIGIVGKPVYVNFKGKTIQITSTTPAYKVVEFWKRVGRKQS